MSEEDKVIVWQVDSSGRKFFTEVDYLHGSKDDRWYRADKMGMSQDVARTYAHALYEVKIELKIYEDGSSKIIKVDDRELKG